MHPAGLGSGKELYTPKAAETMELPLADLVRPYAAGRLTLGRVKHHWDCMLVRERVSTVMLLMLR